MKILHIIPTYLPAYRRGGPIWSVHNMNKWLARKGIEVTVYTTDIDVEKTVPLNQEKLIDGVRAHYFRASFPRVWEYWRVGILPAFLPRHWEYSRDLHKALKQTVKNFDVIQITSTFLFASILGGYYARKYKKPYIISPRGNFMEPLELKNPFKKKLYIRLIEKLVLKNAVVHFTTLQEETAYQKYCLPTYRSSILIPNGIDPEEFQFSGGNDIDFRKKYNINQNDYIALFLGRLNWKKGLDTLIPAFADVCRKNNNVTLIIAGNDEDGYQKKVENWVCEYNVVGQVRFTGLLQGNEKNQAFASSDVFVLPSYSENFGMSVVEAMYFGLPVVVTENVGLAPYIAKTNAGLVVAKQSESIAAAILQILENENMRRIMGKNGKNLVAREFLMPRLADRWIEVYQKLINENYK